MPKPAELEAASDCDNHPQRWLRDLIDSGALELPLLPETATRLLGMCNDPECPPKELAESIRRDQSIASHVLRIANSAMYSGGKPIVSLQQSVARLGMQKIREIVLVISCKGRVFDVEGFEQEVRDSFRRSMGCAAAFAQEIARLLRLNVEDAFLCGLLHDIGRPVLLQTVIDVQRENHVVFEHDAILEAVDILRIVVGSSLIETWNLPNRVALAVRDQQCDQLLSSDDQRSLEVKVLSFAIYLATGMADSAGTSVEEVGKHPLVEQLNLYPDQLQSILSMRDTIEDWISTAQ